MRYSIFILSIFFFSSCLETNTLFDVEQNFEQSGNSMGKLVATEIYSDYISNEIWFSHETGMINVERNDEVFCEGESSLEISWNKLEDGSAWLGLGVGWDNWSGKNFSGIVDNSALHFAVKPIEGKLDHLPIAIGMEDHSGAQAWTGFSKKMMTEATDGWKHIHVPISSFDWSKDKADYSNVKQVIIQFEAAGHIYFDDMRIVPFDGLPKKSVRVPVLEGASQDKQISLSSSRFGVYKNAGQLVITGDIIDPTPMQNSKDESNVWDGDCIEIAFSVDPEDNPNRQSYSSTDYQIGVRANENPKVWCWQKEEYLDNAELKLEPTDNGYRFTLKLNASDFGIEEFVSGKTYGFEIALDQGTESGRSQQIRWNSEDEGLHQNPSLWGKMIIE